MIILKEAIFPPRKFRPIKVHNNNPELGLTKNNMTLYYWVIFMNRTMRNAPYISKFNSLKELEEDIHGICVFDYQGCNKEYDFGELYNEINKQEFLNLINIMIKKYGNLIYLGKDSGVCIKTDEPLNLLSFIENLD